VKDDLTELSPLAGELKDVGRALGSEQDMLRALNPGGFDVSRRSDLNFGASRATESCGPAIPDASNLSGSNDDACRLR
jgi:hypothetical protein